MSQNAALAFALESGLIINHATGTRRADSRALMRGADRGDLTRLVRGVYLETERWNAAGNPSRFRWTLLATALEMADDVVFSHATAAFLLGIEQLAPLPPRVEVTVPPATGGRTSGHVRRYGAPLAPWETTEISGFLVTTPARTICDLARTRPFVDAVAVADAALHRKRRPSPLLTSEELADEADRQRARAGFRRMMRVAEFATPLSDSVRESQSRVLIHELGFPAPVLQHSWRDDAGMIGDSDYWWPDFNKVGEYDGHGKYVKPEFTKGRSIADVVEAEKRREDRIRALGPTVVRWTTEDLTPARLLRKLAASGLPRTSRARYS